MSVAETVAWLRSMDEARRVRAERHAARVHAALPAALALLHAEPGVRGVWIFGSLVTGGFHETSDVDLAVEGLPPERFFPVLGELAGVLPCAVDLVRLEDAPSSLIRTILLEGKPS